MTSKLELADEDIKLILAHLDYWREAEDERGASVIRSQIE